MTAPTEQETWAQAARVTSSHQRDHLIENIKGRLMTAPTEQQARASALEALLREAIQIIDIYAPERFLKAIEFLNKESPNE